jgi:hypothetical protein
MKDDIIRAEHQVLRALCQDAPQGPVRELAKLILKDYRWRDPLNATLFEVLVALRNSAPGVLRPELPALLTRRGFPDLPWEDLFAPHGLTKAEVEALMRHLQKL